MKPEQPLINEAWWRLHIIFFCFPKLYGWLVRRAPFLSFINTRKWRCRLSNKKLVKTTHTTCVFGYAWAFAFWRSMKTGCFGHNRLTGLLVAQLCLVCKLNWRFKINMPYHWKCMCSGCVNSFLLCREIYISKCGDWWQSRCAEMEKWASFNPENRLLSLVLLSFVILCEMFYSHNHRSCRL